MNRPAARSTLEVGGKAVNPRTYMCRTSVRAPATEGPRPRCWASIFGGAEAGRFGRYGVARVERRSQASRRNAPLERAAELIDRGFPPALMSTALQRQRSRSRPQAPRLFERPPQPPGSTRIIERRFGLWRWRTWASDETLASRPRSGWALRFSRALVATQDALDDYQLYPWSRR